ncbi:MAG TPA: helix-turn-helix domain-containing protein [Solirubrobacterales bacterium]|nr:helix-turn-helix domain-containing protein [Solirubrobacterales bacterium]
MSDPTRERLLRHWVEQGVTSPVEASHALRIELTKVSYHARVLRELDFLEEVGTEPVRGSTKHYLRATDRHLVDEPEWKELDPVARDGVAADSMQPLIGDFERAAKSGEFRRPEGDFMCVRIPLKSMDEEGYRELLDAQRRLYEETFEIETRAAGRMEKSGEQGFKVSAGHTCWRVPSF